MSTASITEMLELPLQERIRLFELIRNSVAAVPKDMINSPELQG